VVDEIPQIIAAHRDGRILGFQERVDFLLHPGKVGMRNINLGPRSGRLFDLLEGVEGSKKRT